MRQTRKRVGSENQERPATVMNNVYTDSFAQKLKAYDEAFDFFMDYGRLPEHLPQGVLLGEAIKQTIKDNTWFDGRDPICVEFLKEELMKFTEDILKVFQSIEKQHRKEQALIVTFIGGGIKRKRSLWKQATEIISSQYKARELYLKGYKDQLKESKSDEQAVIILNALGKEWQKACDEKEQERKKKLIEKNLQQWKLHIKDCGFSDCEERRKVEKVFYSCPALKDLLRIIGREQPKREDEMDDVVKRYLPLLPSLPKPAAEVTEIANGNSLGHLLPSETAILSERQTEGLFYYKYATHGLQLFANRPKDECQFKTEQKHEKQPRLGSGPIIVAVDTSGSMSGDPLKNAYAVLMQLLRLARKQKRTVFLMSFSVRSKSLDLSFPRNWMRLNAFLNNRFSGGTDGEEMLNTAIEMLQSEAFAMADVLIISDFCFSLPEKSTRKKMLEEHNKGTRFYGLQIGGTWSLYDKILDKIWFLE